MERIIEINVKDFGILEINTKSFAVPLVYNINDIKEIGTRRSSYSKTIKVIGSKNNNEIFNNLYEIKGINFGYKMRNKYDCSLLVNKIPIFNGYIQLRKITKVLINSTYEIVYEINLFDNVKNLFDDLSKLELLDLDFSNDYEYDGIDYQAADKSGGFDRNEVGVSYNTLRELADVTIYPTIDYGYNEVHSDVFPYGRCLSTGLLYPSVFIKAILDNIFSVSDYDYDSNFLSGDTYDGMYKDLISIYNKSTEFINLKICSGNASIQIVEEEVVTVQFHSDTIEIFETNDVYAFDLSNNIDNGKIYIKTEGIYNLNLLLYISNDVSDDLHTKYELFKFEEEIDEETGDVTYIRSILWTYQLADGETWVNSLHVSLENIELKKGDFLSFQVIPGHEGHDESRVPATPNVKFNCSLTYKKEELMDEETGDDIIRPILVNEILPEMGQDEFIRNQIKLFNLYLYNDPHNDKLITIEPRDYFYEQGITVNWTDKVDYHKSIIVESTIDEVSSIMRFTHEKGDDYYSKSYYDGNNIIYGQKDIPVDGNIKSKLEETVPSLQSYIQKNGHFLTVKLNPEFDSTWFDERTSYRPMIGFVNQVTSQGDLQMGDFYSNDAYNHNVGYYVYTTHSKVIGGNSYDLNYQTVGSFSQSGYDETRGLYNIFWKKYMNNLIDDDARKVTLYVKLDLDDIINLDFRNKVLIDGQVYILEKLEYDPSKDDSSKITLLKEILTEEGSFVDPDLILLNNSGDYITTGDGRIEIHE